MKASEELAQIKEQLGDLAPDHDASSTSVVVLVQRLNIQISRLLDQYLGQKQVHSSGVEVLLALQHAGALPNKKKAATQGIKLSKLAKQLNVTPASITNRVEQLLKVGLVSREIDPKDKRIAYVRLTAEGVAAVKEVLPGLLKAHMTIASPIKKGDRKDLIKALLKLSENLEA